MTTDCEEYRLKLKLKNIEIQKLTAYNSACEDTLLDIELKFDREIKKIRKDITEWKKLDPNCDTTCMEHHLLLLEKFRKEIFKNDEE